MRLGGRLAPPKKQECHKIMRKTVQEWMDANQRSNGPAKKKIAGLKRLKRFPASAAGVDRLAGAKKHRAKKKIATMKKRRPK
jgi:hypothetical protein